MKSSGAFAVALLVVGLAVGGVVGFVIASTQASDAVAPRTGSTATANSDAPPSDEPATPHKVARGRAAASAPGEAVNSSADLPGPVAGHGTITGFVRSKDGAPLAGVVVRASPSRDDEEDAEIHAGHAAPPLNADARMKTLLADLRREQATTREATTDATGAYTLVGLVDSRQKVQAWLAGWRIERADRASWKPVRIGARCDFKATPVTGVRVKVLLPDGTPADEAKIEWTLKGAEDSGSTTCRRGETEIGVAPGTYEFTASSGPQGVFHCDAQTETVAAGAAQEVTLRLAGRPGVRGKVVFASPDHPRQFRVAAVKVDASAAADPTRLFGDAKSKWIDDEDEYSLTDLAPGTYLVGLTFRGGTLGPSGTVTVGADLATLDLSVAGEPRDWVKLWVRGPDGALVHDVTVSCGSRGPGWSGENGLAASPDDDGGYRIEHYESGAPTLGNSSMSSTGDWGAGGKREYYVVVESATYGTERATYDPTVDREVTVRFEAPALLRVTLTGWEQSPDKEVFSLSLRPPRTDHAPQWNSPTAKIDSGGVATFPPAKPAAYELVLCAEFDGGPGGARINREVLRMDVTLQPGDNPLKIPVPAFHDLVVAIVGAAPADGLTLERVDPSGRTSSYATRKQGESGAELSFDHVATGRYRIVAGTSGDMWVNVPEERRVAFRPRPFDAMRVSIDGKGALADAGLVEGDLVVGIDGADFENGPQMEAALASAKANETAKLSVVRGGRRLDVAVDPKRLGDGGSLVPWVR